MNSKERKRHLETEELENLGLDADHSSDNFLVNGLYNEDEDRVTDHPEREEGPDVGADQAENSPLDDK